MRKMSICLRAMLLLCLFSTFQLAQSQTTYLTVGCGGGSLDFPSLRAAFQWVETNYFPADVDISICPGVYNENAFINPFALSGRPIKVHSSTFNPADVTLQPASPFQFQVLRINGVRNMDFEGLTIDVLSAGTGLRRHAARLQGGAGDIDFRNCKLKGASPAFGFYNPANYAVCSVSNLNTVLQFFDSELSGGAMGLHIQSVTGSAVVNLQSTDIFMVEGYGLKQDAPVLYTLLNNCHINCFGPGDWNGVSTKFGPGTKFEMRNSTVITNGAARCHAVLAQAEEVVMENNQIMMAEHDKAFGITVHPEAMVTEVLDNEVAYPGMMYTAVRPDSFMGIQRLATPVINHQLDRLEFSGNEVECTGANEGVGMFVEILTEDFNQGVFVRENEIRMEDMGGENAFWLLGLAVRGRSSGSQGELEIKANRIFLEPVSGYVSYGIWASQLNPVTDAQVFNNVVEMAHAGTDSSTGIGMGTYPSQLGSKIWMGNNAVTLENSSSRHCNGLYFHGNLRADYSLWHNSILVHGNNSLYTSDALQIWGYAHDCKIELLDNIFANTTGGRAFQISYHTGNWVASNSNCYYSLPSTDLGWWGTYPVADLAALQAATLDDAQSVELDPVFVAPNNLHLGGGSPLLGINGLHLPFSGPTLELLQDIDGDARLPSNNREIGCDERGILEIPDTIQYKTQLVAADKPSFYPNPCQNQAQFNWPGHAEGKITLLDQQGKVLAVWKGGLEAKPLDLSQIPAGSYLLRAEDESTVHVQRIVRMP